MMRQSFLTILTVILVVSCNTAVRTYQTISPIEHVSNIPVATKEKGDLQLDGSLYVFGNGNSERENRIKQIVKERNSGMPGVQLGLQYAITDKFSVGGQYRYSSVSDSIYGHTAGGSVNFALIVKTKKPNVRYDFDVLAGVQYRAAHNLMKLKGLQYYTNEIEPLYVDTLPIHDLAFFQIRDKYIRYYIQPSFMLDRKNFSFYLGGALVYQQQLEMKVHETPLNEYMPDPNQFNPIQRDFISRGNFFLVELFTGIGAGPEMYRFNLKVGLGNSSVGGIVHMQMGITSNLNIKKLSEQRRSKKAAKLESDGPLN